MRSAARTGALGKNRGVDLPGGTVESPAQVILRVTMPAGKAWTAVTQHICDIGPRCARLEEFSRYPLVCDAPAHEPRKMWAVQIKILAWPGHGMFDDDA